MAQAHRIKPPLKLDIFRYVRWMIRETLFLLTLVVAGYLLFALLDFDPRDAGWTHTGPEHVYNRAGAWGAWLADVGFYFFGYLAYLFPLALGLLGWRLFHVGALAELDGEVVFFRVLGFLVALGAGCGLATLHLQGVPGSGSGGGIVGTLTGQGLLGTFDALGVYSYLAANLFMLMLFVAAITLALGRALMDLLELLGQVASAPIALVLWLMAQLQGKASPPVTADAQAAPAAPAEPATAPATPLAASPLVAAAAPKDGGGIRVEPVINPFLEQPSPAAKADAGPVATPEALPPASSALAPTLPASSAPAPTPPRLEKEPVPATVSESPSLPAAMASWIGTLTGKRHETEPPAPAVLKTATAATAAPQPAPATGPIPPPPLDLLTVAPTEPGGYSTDVLETMSRQVETLLQHYGIGAEVVAVEPGPVITCFELAPALGVKVNQISNLAKDLARGLSVPSVRVVEVIPGKSVIGLEIPNQRRKTVYLSEILDSAAYRESESALTLVLGKDIGGRPIVANLARMPHLLVAGTTGSGKSVAINAMLLSMLYKADPSQVRLILVDPKMLELSIYEDIPHLLAPVVTDMKQAANALRWCVGEMDRRYRLMATLKVRNIAGFNQKVVDAAESGSPLTDPLYRLEQPWEEGPVPALEPLPFIVVIVDELADMMMTVGKQVEELIARLAQKARAAGIHLILATQRPSVDVITGLIKANIPTRIAFQVSSKVDSRTILDQMGAEQLLGCGDMLYLPPGTGFPLRVHGAFVDDAEVLRVVEHLRRQGRADYRPEVLEENIGAAAGVAGAAGGGEADPLYDEAVRIVTETQRASVSGVQRRLKIGYNRAARMIEEMEAAGIVGPLQGNGSREVLAAAPPEDN